MRRCCWPLLLAACGRINFGQPLLDPVAYWRFDEGSGLQATDEIGGHVLALTSVTWTTGRLGTAIELNGIDSLALGSTPSDLDNLREVTFVAWIAPRSDGKNGYGAIVSKGGGGDTSSKRFLINSGSMSCMGGACLEMAVNQTVVYGGAMSTPGTVTFATWQLVAGTYDVARGGTVYRDGVETTATQAPGIGTLEDDAATGYAIGGWSVPTMSGVFDGAIDEVRIYDRVLAPHEIRAIYQAY